MFIIYMIHPINILISSFLYYEIITGSNKEKSVKQLKYDACYKLVQSRAEQDKRHFKELSSILKPEEINNILQYSLFECYQNIDFYDAEFLDEKNIKEINIYINDEKFLSICCDMRTQAKMLYLTLIIPNKQNYIDYMTVFS